MKSVRPKPTPGQIATFNLMARAMDAFGELMAALEKSRGW
jgi:hypothetical protein